MSRMIRSSPKINFKQSITSPDISNTVPKRNSNVSKNYKNRLHLNRFAVDKNVLTHESTRNEKLEGLLQKHIMNPVRTSSGHQKRSQPSVGMNSGLYNQSSVIGNSLSYTNEGRRRILYISPKLAPNDRLNKN